MRLHERLAAAREQLVRAGIQPTEAAIDVDLYARTILKWDRARLLLHHQSAVPETLEPQFSDWLARRERFEPSAYIVGEREFWGLDFFVTPAVLVPRPETELVVEATAAIARGLRGQNLRIADIGTGSGCIAVSVAHEIPHCTVIATDVSSEALAVAQRNAERHAVDDRIRFVCTSHLDGVDGEFDVIAANPPYVRTVDKRGLSADVLQEPHVALFGGASGLEHIDAVLAAASHTLRPGGWLVMEFGFGQEDDVRELVSRRANLSVDHTRADLQGLARTAIMQRR
ncbi:MAG TPA: peptide chain release factor N(5)-glutamine methyltransferase [Vicinamibacterales bacterium]|nr:peptide chain release factor N(5)-glutamine methyltransferase [Vicinamibacterales bacterium]